jgi:hypothetical protein
MREWRYSSNILENSALDGDKWSASRPGRFIPEERPTVVGPRAGLATVEKREIYCPSRESNPAIPARRYTDWDRGVTW